MRDGRWEMEVGRSGCGRKWFGRSGWVDGSGYGRVSREQGGAERGVWSEVEIRIWVDGYRIHRKKRMQASIRSEISSTPII